MRSRFAHFCVLSLAVAICTVPAFAAPTEVTFHDHQGNLITAASINLETAEGERVIAEPTGTGTYTFDLAPGQKVMFRAFDPNPLNKWHPDQRRLPIDLAAGLDITLYQVQFQHTCGEAAPLAVPSVTPFDTTGAGGDPLVDGAVCGTAALTLGDGLWYTVEGTGNTMTASTCLDADFDTQIAVFCADCEELTCVAGNDDGDSCGISFTSEVSWASQEGSTYAIYVTGYTGGGFTPPEFGAGNLTLTDDGVPATASVDCLPPEPDVPTGACCNCLNEPFNCMIVTEADCIQMNANAAPGVVLGYLGNDSSCVALGTNPFSYISAPGTPIPDGTGANMTSNTPALAVINVPDSFFVGDVNVDFSTGHTWASDLQVALQSPSGTLVVLSSRLCNGTNGAQSGQTTTYDDAGADSITACTLPSGPTVGTINSDSAQGGFGNATGTLATFEGEPANGNWTLVVQDLFVGDVGNINTFNLHFLDASPVCPVIMPNTTTGGTTGGTTGDDDDDESDDESGSGKSGHVEAEGQTAAGSDGILDLSFGGRAPSNTTADTTKQRVDRSDAGSRSR